MFRKIRFSINAKLVVIIVCFLCIPFGVFGIVLYEKSTRTVETNAVNYSLQLVEQVNAQLDTYFSSLEKTTYPLLTAPVIQEFARLSPDDYYGRFSAAKKIEEELLPNFIFGRSDIQNVVVVSKAGIATTNIGGVESLVRYKAYLEEMKPEDQFKISGINYVNRVPVITAYRKFVETTTFQTSGIIVVDLYLSELSKMIQNVRLGKTGTIWIVDRDNRYVLHDDADKQGKPVPAEEAADIQIGNQGYLIQEKDGVKQLVIYHRSVLSGWTMVSVIPIHEVIEEIIQLRNISAWVGIALVVLALFAVGGFSYYLTRSLLQLKRLMNRAESGDLSVAAAITSNDEIGSVNRSFNNMVGEIRGLVEVIHKAELKEKELQIRQRDSKLMALQARINPHFLYNTLEVINSHAIINGQLPISKMTASLAAMFRYSTEDSDPVVSLEEELTHIQTYIRIQKERYRALEAEVQIEPAVLQKVRLVRLTLQPLVENAFLHGYDKHKIKPAYLNIFGEATGACCVIRIEDHGGGMPADRRKQWNDLFEQLCRNPGDSSVLPSTDGTGMGMGMWNVHYRTVLHFGPEYGLRVGKSDRSGTILELRLPYDGKP